MQLIRTHRCLLLARSGRSRISCRTGKRPWTVWFGSKADMLDCRKKSPLYAWKQTFCETSETISYVPEADVIRATTLQPELDN